MKIPTRNLEFGDPKVTWGWEREVNMFSSNIFYKSYLWFCFVVFYKLRNKLYKIISDRSILCESRIMRNLYSKSLNHRFIGWKRPLRSSSPTVTPKPPCLLNHIPKVPHLHIFLNPPRMVTPQLPWAACSNVWPNEVIQFRNFNFKILSQK